MGKESLWIGLLEPELDRPLLLKAHKLCKQGIGNWHCLISNHTWDLDILEDIAPLLRPLVANCFMFAVQNGYWPSTGKYGLHQMICWPEGKALLPLPNLPVDNSF